MRGRTPQCASLIPSSATPSGISTLTPMCSMPSHLRYPTTSRSFSLMIGVRRGPEALNSRIFGLAFRDSMSLSRGLGMSQRGMTNHVTTFSISSNARVPTWQSGVEAFSQRQSCISMPPSSSSFSSTSLKNLASSPPTSMIFGRVSSVGSSVLPSSNGQERSSVRALQMLKREMPTLKQIHLRINARRRKTHIHWLKRKNGWVTDHKLKEDIIHTHFQSIIGRGQPRTQDFN